MILNEWHKLFTMKQRWKWVSGPWVMGQVGHHFWMGHVGHGDPLTHDDEISITVQ